MSDEAYAGHYDEDDDFGDFDLRDIYTTEETNKEEDQRHAGLGMVGGGRGLWYMMQLGKQIFQFVPHRYRRADGVVTWDWRCVFHIHQPNDREQKTLISTVDEELEKALKDKFPGWQYVCKRETFTQGKCNLCDLKWEVGRWFKDHTKQGWKHPACKSYMSDNGLYTKKRVLAWILPLSHSGDWLQNTKEGRDWAEDERRRMQSGKSAAKASDRYQRGYQEAIKQSAAFSGQELKPVLTILPKDLYEDLSRRSSSDMYGDNAAGRVIDALQFVVEINIDPDTGNRKFVVEVHPKKRHLVQTEDGEADEPGIMEMVRSVRNLRQYREYDDPTLEATVDKRVDALRSKANLIVRDIMSVPEPTPEPKPESSGSYVQKAAPVEPPVEAKVAEPKPKTAKKTKTQPPPEPETVEADVESTSDTVSGGVQMEPTKEKGPNGLPLCFGQGLQDPLNHVCRKCEFEGDCEDPDDEADGEDGVGVEMPF